jgi:hypothetical protein
MNKALRFGRFITILCATGLLLNACSTMPTQTTQEAAAPVCVAEPLEGNYKEKIGTPVRKIEWDGPCQEVAAETPKIAGFEVAVLDRCANPVATKFVPVRKKDKKVCGKYSVKATDFEPKLLSRILRKGQFKGWIAVSSVDDRQTRSEQIKVEIPVAKTEGVKK